MSGKGQADVIFEGVRIEFGGRTVLNELSCAFPRGGITVLLGGSGRGKTTLLRSIGGLIPVAGGHIHVLGSDITRLSERQLFGVRAQLGMMFQNGALLDSNTIFDNLALPLREHTNSSPSEIEAEVRACLESVGLSGVEDLLPRQLSGGMIKRAALARAILMKPQILLCDEPFSGLDPVSAQRIEGLLVELCRSRNMSVIVVSHDVASTLRMAKHVVLLLEDGVFQGTPEELKDSSNTAVTTFLDPHGALNAHADLRDVEAMPGSFTR